MKRTFMLAALLMAGCHAHQVAQRHDTMASVHNQPQVASERPVRTTPGSMLDKTSMKKIQGKLHVQQSGELDDATQAALKKFQKQQSQPETGLPDFDTLRRLGLDPKDIYERLAIRDVQEGADVLAQVHREADGRDGFVSLEVAPELAHDTEGTLQQVRSFWKRLDRPNVMIKIPGTPEGVPAIEQSNCKSDDAGSVASWIGWQRPQPGFSA